MKKFICLIMIFVFAVLFVGCNNKDDIQYEFETSSIVSDNIHSVFNNVKAEKTKNITFSTEYEIVECCMGYFIATSNEGRLYGLLDSNGDIVIDFIYDNLTFGVNVRENVIYAKSEEGKGIIDFKGDIIIALEYDEIKEYEEFCNYTFAKKSGDIYLLLENLEERILEIEVVRNDMGFIYPLGDSYFLARNSPDGNICDTIYDLDGQILLSHTGLPLMCDRVNKRYVAINEEYWENKTPYAKLSFYDNDFNLCSTVDTESYIDFVENVSDETGIAELRDGEKVLVEYATGNVIKDFDPNINSDDSISVQHKSDTYRVYDSNGNDLFNERFYDVEELTNKYILLENLTGQKALINRYGEVMYDFGSITEDSIYGYVKEAEFLNEDMYCAVVGSDGNYTVYAYIN